MGFEIERPVLGHVRKPTVLGMAPVANQALAHDEKQPHVRQSRGKQHGERKIGPIEIPCHAADSEPGHNDRQPQALRKILPHEQIAAAADQAAPQFMVFPCAGRRGQHRPTMATSNRGTIDVELFGRCRIAMRARKGNVHENLSTPIAPAFDSSPAGRRNASSASPLEPPATEVP